MDFETLVPKETFPLLKIIQPTVNPASFFSHFLRCTDQDLNFFSRQDKEYVRDGHGKKKEKKKEKVNAH